MEPSFDYVPARDGLALLTGGPGQAGYAGAPPGGIWQPRFSTEAAPKGHGNVWNGEYQFYADPEYNWSNGFTPFSIVDGALRIRAERTAALGFRAGEIPKDPLTGAPYQWVSGVLNSRRRFIQQGGYFEIEARVPNGIATWPAFWLLPADEVHPPEIDVFEHLGHQPDKYRVNCISLGPAPNETTVDTGHDLGETFHRFGCLWTDTSIRFYLDGACTATKPIAGRREFFQPFYLIVNLAIGSRKAEWVPAPDDSMPGPVALMIRSVKAWQKKGPRQVVASATAVAETAPPGTRVGTLSCVGADDPEATTFRLLDDAGGSFTVSGRSLLTARRLRFQERPYCKVVIEASDGQGRTWQQPVSVTVLDEGVARNALANESERSLADPTWRKSGVRLLSGAGKGAGQASAGRSAPGVELVLEQSDAADHAVEQFISKPARAIRYVVSADLRTHGREWVKFEIAAGYGKNVQAYFDLARAVAGTRFTSQDASPYILHDCRATRLESGFVRCQVELTTDAGPQLRVCLKLVRHDADDALHAGETGRGVASRTFFRLVEIDGA